MGEEKISSISFEDAMNLIISSIEHKYLRIQTVPLSICMIK